jgi:AraC-like DNA-binding protein
MNIRKVLSARSPYAELDPADIGSISPSFHLKSFSPGDILLQQNLPIERVGFLHSGMAEIFVRNNGGKAFRIGYLQEGNDFGITAAVGDGISIFNVVCKDPVTCLLQGRKDFFRMIDKYPSVREYFYRTALEQISGAFRVINGSIDEFDIGLKPLARKPRIIERALIYIEKNYRQSISLDEVAKVNCMSKYHFSRTFKAKVGFSFTEYLNRKRIEAAKRMMKNEDVNVSEACFAVGFNDLSYFSRLFRRYEKTTPSEYRKSANATGT